MRRLFFSASREVTSSEGRLHLVHKLLEVMPILVLFILYQLQYPLPHWFLLHLSLGL